MPAYLTGWVRSKSNRDSFHLIKHIRQDYLSQLLLMARSYARCGVTTWKFMSLLLIGFRPISVFLLNEFNLLKIIQIRYRGRNSLLSLISLYFGTAATVIQYADGTCVEKLIQLSVPVHFHSFFWQISNYEMQTVIEA